ncbi:hypothetical protein WA026_010911 [Henosepilachna vigintioctopunctata]|uniref:Uncharacterized protein n=1 Tax=Henosepilachna vigintioctopunctata TaxID=420089 RepID=A0AAW1USC1_9CUCU
MTSKSFNVVVDVEAENSSRVLRPPGSGHTDIFANAKKQKGAHSRNGKKRRPERRNAFPILEGTNQEKPSDVLSGHNVTHTKHEE